ncbi:MAG TPA: hypothetical protein VG453_07700 [Nitrospira sp.]|jgi:hypothetical protein|nr:hypothetical protein [Nitrospira sp.]
MYKGMLLASALWFCASGWIYAEGGFPTRIGPSGEFVELEHSDSGQIVKEYLPLHQIGNIRYFTAGVGLLERQAAYPPFSLKLVFTAGGKPYLTGVDVAIRAVNGETAITIPKEQVEGPWLFVDLPTGMYDITATYGAEQRSLKGMKIMAGKQTTLYVRWPEDAGATVNLPNE